jgi:hypothetical protein
MSLPTDLIRAFVPLEICLSRLMVGSSKVKLQGMVRAKMGARSILMTVSDIFMLHELFYIDHDHSITPFICLVRCRQFCNFKRG